jgi:hypothetical protein
MRFRYKKPIIILFNRWSMSQKFQMPIQFEISNGVGSKMGSVAAQLSVSEYVIRFRSAFGTSHCKFENKSINRPIESNTMRLHCIWCTRNHFTSSSTEGNDCCSSTSSRVSHTAVTSSRTNALISITIGNCVGYGEVGLPPKKPLCYESDLKDVFDYFVNFAKHSATLTSINSDNSYDPFSLLDPSFFPSLRSVPQNDTDETRAVRQLFRALDTCSLNSHKSSRAARSGIESALLDLWGKLTNKAVSEERRNEQNCIYRWIPQHH